MQASRTQNEQTRRVCKVSGTHQGPGNRRSMQGGERPIPYRRAGALSGKDLAVRAWVTEGDGGTQLLRVRAAGGVAIELPGEGGTEGWSIEHSRSREKKKRRKKKGKGQSNARLPLQDTRTHTRTHAHARADTTLVPYTRVSALPLPTCCCQFARRWIGRPR